MEVAEVDGVEAAEDDDEEEADLRRRLLFVPLVLTSLSLPMGVAHS